MARNERLRGTSPLLLFCALLASTLIPLTAEASLPRTSRDATNPAALAGAGAVHRGQLLAAGLEPPFSLITADELEEVLACNPGPEVGGLNLVKGLLLEPPGLASRACEAISLHLEPVEFGLNPQRGPSLEIPNLHQGWFVADSKTRIGGFRLKLEDLIKGECYLSLGLRRGYGVGGWGNAEEERSDPWGLAEDAAFIASQARQMRKEGASSEEILKWQQDEVRTMGKAGAAQLGLIGTAIAARAGASHLQTAWLVGSGLSLRQLLNYNWLSGNLTRLGEFVLEVMAPTGPMGLRPAYAGTGWGSGVRQAEANATQKLESKVAPLLNQATKAVAGEVESKGVDIALSLSMTTTHSKGLLGRFARQVDALTYHQWERAKLATWGEDFGDYFREAARNARRIKFNLSGLDRKEAFTAKIDFKEADNITNSELRTILDDPQLFQKAVFYENGKIVDRAALLEEYKKARVNQ